MVNPRQNHNQNPGFSSQRLCGRPEAGTFLTNSSQEARATLESKFLASALNQTRADLIWQFHRTRIIVPVLKDPLS
jgi:hypothetical protein